MIALAGNPNSGKTTLFNYITGAHQHVGNWPGVTVEKKEGQVSHKGQDFTVVDLPGTYSLTAYSIEEIVARKFIIHEKPDVVVHVIDAGNLERNLFLTTQLIELQCNLVLALNMADVVRDKGASIDIEKLGKLLGAPAVMTVGYKGEGIDALMDTVLLVAKGEHPLQRHVDVRYGHEIENHIEEISEIVKSTPLGDVPGPARLTSLKLLESDKEIVKCVQKSNAGSLLEQVAKTRDHLYALYKDDPETVLTERRYGFISGILKEVYTEPPLDRVSKSDRIDEVLTHKYLGLPVFFLMLWGMFQLTFSVGAYPMEWIEAGVGYLSDIVDAQMAEGLYKSLLVDGIINGVGSVLIFLPNIFLLFMCISILEDSGYMARAAFLTDRVMHLLGLHGKAFIPMLMGFGCNAPAIMATRTLESERDRILSILINPLVSCSARLPIYILIAGAFFAPESAGTVIFSIYFLGLFLAVLMGRLFSKTILSGEAAPFVMELPPYRFPTARSLFIHTWDRGKIFLRKMGGVILIGSIVIWFLGSFPQNINYSRDYEGQIASIRQDIKSVPSVETEETLTGKLTRLESEMAAEKIEKSFIGQIGRFVEPIFTPLHFDWKIAVALGTGFVAKEIVVSTIGVLYHVGAQEDEESGGFRNALKKSGMNPLIAYAFMAFVLIYTPCLGTLAAIRRETNSWKWTFFSVGYSLVLAWIVAFVIVQGGHLIGLG